MKTYEQRDEAEHAALELANYTAAPVLLMQRFSDASRSWFNRFEYTVGLRTDWQVRNFGWHLATAHRSGLLEIIKR